MVTKSKRKNNELIKKRRKKKRLKHLFVFFIFLVSCSVILCLKLPYFDIAEIVVKNNKAVNGDEIIKRSGIEKGTNIFYMNTKKIVTKIENNPYISDASIKRELPNRIVINVVEKRAVYYTTFNNEYFIIDDSGVVLEKVNSINGMNLIFISGVNEKNCVVGKSIFANDVRQIDVVNKVASLKLRLKSPLKLTAIDVSDIVDIKVYFVNMCIKIGDDENIESKINKGINIILDNSLKDAKGYVDVSFKGNPVYFIEK